MSYDYERAETALRIGRTRDGVLRRDPNKNGGTSGFKCGLPGCTGLALVGSYRCRACTSDERRRWEQEQR